MTYEIMLAVSALISQTGIQKMYSYDISLNEIIDICDNIDYSFNEYSIDFIGDVYSIDASNKYLLVSNNNDWYLINKEYKTIIDYGSYIDDPYFNHKNDFKIYNPTSIEFTYAIYDDGFINLENNDDLNFYNLGNYINELSTSTDTFDRSNGTNYQEDTVLIKNAYYFENLNNWHAENWNETCTIVASTMLLGYFDTFYNDNIIAEQYDMVTSGAFSNCSRFTQSPGYGYDPSYTESTPRNNIFHDYIGGYLGKDITNEDVEFSISRREQWQMIKSYLNDRNITYNEYLCEGNALDSLNNTPKNLIKDTINRGLPVIANGAVHSVVAYGYDDEYVYVHTGWGFVARTPWSTYTNWSTNYCPGATRFEITSPHVHSNNYYSTTKNLSLCPCNEIVINTDSTVVLDRSIASKFRIVYTAKHNGYVSFSTDVDDYDVSFDNIETSFNYSYTEDIDNESDYSNYNPILSINNITVGGIVEFEVDLSYIPIDVDLITCVIEINMEDE